MGKCLRTLKGHSGRISSVVMTPDGCRGLSGSWDNTVKLWDLKTGKCLCTLYGHSLHVAAVAISDDARLGLSASWDKTVKVWDLESGECLQTVELAGVFSLAFTSDGQLGLLAGLTRNLNVLDVKSGRLIALETASKVGQSVAITPDGHWVQPHFLSTADVVKLFMRCCATDYG